MLTVSTPEAIAQVLKKKLGLALKIDSILQRPNRCIAVLPNSQMAVLATSEAGARLMHSERKILLYKAISAITFLAYRKGIENETSWCGRTYDEDLAWTQLAISKPG